LLVVFIFFFSSRRRHTRFSRDWSSDVCSSDLGSLFITCYILFTRSVITQLLQVQADLKQMSKGDFQLKAMHASYDEIAVISQHVHEAADGLNRYINEIVDGLRFIAEG